MYARSTTLRGNLDAIDKGIAMVRDEVMPALQKMPGCVGVSMLVDRETGGAVVTSSWDDEDAMRAAEPSVGPMRDRAAQVFGGRPEVREWEIAVLHRTRPAPDAACARVTWTRIDPDDQEHALEQFRTNVLPRIEQMAGFCSASLMIDRRTGAGAAAIVFEDRAALENSRLQAGEIRTSALPLMRAELVDVAEFEVALAHLRVPETV